jgi:hypothetical protein
VHSQEFTSDWKRNAGASYLLGRIVATISDLPPRFVKANVVISSIVLGKMRLHFLPDLMLVYEGGRFGAVPYSSLNSRVDDMPVMEHESLPQDAEVIRHTWRFVNKDGGPDRRFNNNRKIPVVRYGQLTLQSRTGLNLVMQSSRVQACEEFATRLRIASGQGAPRSGANPAHTVANSRAQALRELGLEDSATEDEIKVAYRQMAVMYHPDKVAQMAPEFRALAEERMKEINAAYAILRPDS